MIMINDDNDYRCFQTIFPNYIILNNTTFVNYIIYYLIKPKVFFFNHEYKTNNDKNIIFTKNR